MEHINFIWEYPPSGNSVLQVGVSNPYSSSGSIHSDGTYKLLVGVSTHREQYISSGREYPPRRNSILQVGVSTQREQYTSGGSIHQEGTVYFRWEYQPSTPHLGEFIPMEHINFRWEYLP
jgi:hypothetical protein